MFTNYCFCIRTGLGVGKKTFLNVKDAIPPVIAEVMTFPAAMLIKHSKIAPEAAPISAEHINMLRKVTRCSVSAIYLTNNFYLIEQLPSNVHQLFTIY